MRDAIPSPEQARREYWKNRESEISLIKWADFSFANGTGIWCQSDAARLLKRMHRLETLISIILSHKDEIYISKQVMENLLEDAAWLEKVRAKAEHFLKR